MFIVPVTTVSPSSALTRVTTVRGVPLGGNAFTVGEKARSAKNEIVAPRIYNYQRAGSGWDRGTVDTPDVAGVNPSVTRGMIGLALQPVVALHHV
jgi:hypothetical protein